MLLMLKLKIKILFFLLCVKLYFAQGTKTVIIFHCIHEKYFMENWEKGHKDWLAPLVTGETNNRLRKMK